MRAMQKPPASLQRDLLMELGEQSVTPSLPHTGALGTGQRLVGGPGKVPQPLGTGRLWHQVEAGKQGSNKGGEKRKKMGTHPSFLLLSSYKAWSWSRLQGGIWNLWGLAAMQEGRDLSSDVGLFRHSAPAVALGTS